MKRRISNKRIRCFRMQPIKKLHSGINLFRRGNPRRMVLCHTASLAAKLGYGDMMGPNAIASPPISVIK